MKATDYDTYQDYVKARAGEGLQVLPSLLWKALKTKNIDLVTAKPIIIGNT
jgi:hypothetical protein